MMWNLQSYPTINERMWHLRGSEHILYTFSGGQNTQPHDLRPWSPPYGCPPSLQQPEIEFITVVIGYCTSVLLSAVPYFATSHVVVLQPLYNLTARCHLSYICPVTLHRAALWGGGPNASRRLRRCRDTGRSIRNISFRAHIQLGPEEQ